MASHPVLNKKKLGDAQCTHCALGLGRPPAGDSQRCRLHPTPVRRGARALLPPRSPRPGSPHERCLPSRGPSVPRGAFHCLRAAGCPSHRLRAAPPRSACAGQASGAGSSGGVLAGGVLAGTARREAAGREGSQRGMALGPGCGTGGVGFVPAAAAPPALGGVVMR